MERVMLVMITVALAACATAKPVFYDNEKYQAVGREGADRDVAECRARAEEAGATPGSGRAGAAAKSAGTGAVGGAVAGSAGIGAAAGAAGGVVWSLFSTAFGWMGHSQPDPAFVNYVDLCLADRGYQVTGWQ